MILLGILVGIVIAFMRGGKLERLGNLGLKGLPLVFAAIVLRFVASALAGSFIYAPWLQIASYLIFLYVLFLNIAFPGMKLFGLGTLLNFIVIAANGGVMPVSAEALVRAGRMDQPSGLHTLMGAGTRLSILADIIPLPYPLPRPVVISVGDLLLIIGIIIFIQHRMLTPELTK